MPEREYTAADCTCTGLDMPMPPRGKVFVLDMKNLCGKYKAPVYPIQYCKTDTYLNSHGSFYATSLKDGKRMLVNCNDALGVLKPELLSDSERLQLSQIRPTGVPQMKTNITEYFGYCFLQDGHYIRGLPLGSSDEVKSYIDMQKDYQHRIMICDSSEYAVFEMIDGKMIYPTQGMLEEYAAQQEQGIGGIGQSL